MLIWLAFCFAVSILAMSGFIEWSLTAPYGKRS